ncbi:MAG: GCN5-related N-acetyltransferase [Klenkia sp.]|nr:GCN5-related N-acetyltransferase [Klenkia sp.]
MTAPAVIEQVAAAATHPLRAAVLRQGRPVEIEGDDDPTTLHLAARLPSGEVVGVVRLHPQACAWRPAQRPWQLRAMATDPTVRGTGAGRALVSDALARLAAAGADLVWCEARVTAVGFYQRLGFVVVTDEFEVPMVGPHHGMVVGLPVS